MSVASIPQLHFAVALGPMPAARRMTTHDLGIARAPVQRVFELVRNVADWPRYLAHYRWVRMLEQDANGGGVVEMAADRPFGPLRWPTYWRSVMEVDHVRPAVRFRHIAGVTAGMDVEWAFEPIGDAAGHVTAIKLVHLWDGPRWPLIGPLAATAVIGPVFVHGIASRTVAGLVRAAEQRS